MSLHPFVAFYWEGGARRVHEERKNRGREEKKKGGLQCLERPKVQRWPLVPPQSSFCSQMGAMNITGIPDRARLVSPERYCPSLWLSDEEQTCLTVSLPIDLPREYQNKTWTLYHASNPGRFAEGAGWFMLPIRSAWLERWKMNPRRIFLLLSAI